LAKELLESPDVLAEEWPWLTSGEAADAWRFGEALAQEDAGKTLTTTVMSLGEAGRDLRVLCGYICTYRRTLGDDWYEQWVESQFQQRPRPINLLFEVAWRCGATSAVARRVAEVLRADTVAPEVVGQLGFGTWGEDLEPEILEEVLRAMLDAGHYATALTILEHRTKSAGGERERWRPLALQLVTTPELIRSGHMTSYYWKELATSLVSDHPGEVAAAIIREQGDRSAGTWFAEHSEAAEVLDACVEKDPGAVWSALLPQLSSKGSAYMFSIGFPRGVVERVPPEQVLGWVDQRPGERAAIVAKLAKKDFANDETLAARILGAHGDREDVASAFFGEYVSGTWWGPASTHWEQLAATVDQVAKRTNLPKLRGWAADAACELRRMAERDRQREEEEDLRSRQ